MKWILFFLLIVGGCFFGFRHYINDQIKKETIQLKAEMQKELDIPQVAPERLANPLNSKNMKGYLYRTARDFTPAVHWSALELLYRMQQEDLDEGALLEIARLTGGDFFRATNYSELQNIYSKIDSLEKTRFNNPITVNRKDYYGIFLSAAVILLLLEVLVLRTAFFRIP